MPETTHINEWTIIILIYAEIHIKNKQSLFCEIGSFFSELLRVPLPENIKLLILLNKSRLIGLEPNSKNGSTALYEVSQPPERKQKYLRVLYYQKTADTLQNAEKLGEILESISTDKYLNKGVVTKGKRYAVITWGHGSVYGIFKALPNTSTSQQVAWSQKSFEILTNEAISLAFKNGFKQKRVDILLMHNCLMMNVHACRALMDCVDYLVAPQTMIEAPSYNYKAILKGFGQQEADAETISLLCVDTLTNERNNEEQSKIDQWAVFAVKLETYKEVVETIDQIAATLLQALASNNRLRILIKTARNRCYQFDQDLNYHQIDFIHWFDELINQISVDEKIDQVLLNELFNFKNKLQKSVTACLTAKYLGQNIYNKKLQAGIIKLPPSGLSIYFPKQKVNAQANYKFFIQPGSPNQCRFLYETPLWLQLVENVIST